MSPSRFNSVKKINVRLPKGLYLWLFIYLDKRFSKHLNLVTYCWTEMFVYRIFLTPSFT